MTNQSIITLENQLHGFHTRLKELHYSASSVSIHTILDDFDKALQEFDDNVLEDAQGMFGIIQPGTLSPILPEALEPHEFLVELRGVLGGFYESLGDSLTWTGIKSEIENFWHTLNKTIYLIEVAKGK